MAQQSFAAAMKGYFGFKEGQNLAGFQAELKELNDDDRAYYVRELRKAGVDVADAAPVKPS